MKLAGQLQSRRAYNRGQTEDPWARDFRPLPILQRVNVTLELEQLEKPQQPEETQRTQQLDDAAVEQYLVASSRLACQLVLQPEHDGLEITLPDDVCNVLEVPLWLRNSR